MRTNKRENNICKVLCSEELWSHEGVVCGRVVFGDVVGFVCLTRAPVDDELALCNAVLDPVEAHVNCL